MIRVDRSKWSLTPSQQEQYEALRAKLGTLRSNQRPFLVTGDVGVGKTFLARRLAAEPAAYYNIAQDYLASLLVVHTLADLTPEAVVRFVKDLLKDRDAPYAVVDGLEPLLCLWAVERAKTLPNFFIASSRAILPQPLLVVIQTSPKYVPYNTVRKDEWWPPERRFRLELTQEDKEVVARNWGLDPMRGHISANLYELLATKLEG